MSEAFEDATLTVNVVVVRDWRFRLGFFLLRAGCWVLRCHLTTADPCEPK